MTNDRGIALVLVLWLLALLAMMVVTFSGDARTGLLLSRNQGGGAAAQAIADAGVVFAILGVFDPDPVTRWRVDGQEHPVQFGGGDIVVSIQDEGGKIDLNKGPVLLLTNLVTGLGIADAGRVLAEIAARRDQFVAVEELHGIIDNAGYDRLAPFVTVASHAPQIDLMTAPRAVLLSIPDMTPEKVDQFIDRRSTEALGTAPSLDVKQEVLRGVPLRAFTVRSQAKLPNGARFTREAIIVLSAQEERRFHFETWRRQTSGP